MSQTFVVLWTVVELESIYMLQGSELFRESDSELLQFCSCVSIRLRTKLLIIDFICNMQRSRDSHQQFDIYGFN